MKPIAISSCIALAAVSLFAANPQATKKPAAEQPPAAHTQTLFSSPQQSSAGDSPLVRAAKSTGRLAKTHPSQVITNDTLVREGGHFTTSAMQVQPSPVPAQTSNAPSFEQMMADAQRKRIEAAAAAQRAKKAEEEKRFADSRAAGRVEGDTPELFYGNPALVDGPPQPIKPMTPETMGQQPKPPL
jgi:hypothetical protein